MGNCGSDLAAQDYSFWYTLGIPLRILSVIGRVFGLGEFLVGLCWAVVVVRCLRHLVEVRGGWSLAAAVGGFWEVGLGDG